MDIEQRFIYALLTATRYEQQKFYLQQLPRGVFKLREVEIAWVFDYRTKYGRYPSIRLYNTHFQEEPLHRHKDPMRAVLRQITDTAMFEQLRSLVNSTKEVLEKGGNVPKAFASFKDAASKLTDYSSETVDIRFGRSSTSLDRYRQRVRDIAEGRKSLLTTPWPTMNKMIKHLEPGDVVVIAARTNIGKAQPLTAKVLTPDGFISMSSVDVGTTLVDEKGHPQIVTEIYPQGKLKVFRVEFNDGTSTECCDDHLWSVSSHDSKKRGDYSFKVLPLKEIRKRIKSGGRLLWEVPAYEGTKNNTSTQLPIKPWLLGFLIGDGCLIKEATFTNSEADNISKVTSALHPTEALTDCGEGDYRIRRKERIDKVPCPTMQALRDLGLVGKRAHQKFIPTDYLYAGYQDRLELLQGLMDTDGYVPISGTCYEYATSSRALSMQVALLVRSLGGFAKVFYKTPHYTYLGDTKEGRRCYIIRFRMPVSVIPVSSAKHTARLCSAKKKYRKMISDIVPLGRKECQCIRVSGSSSLYVTDDFIVTHNTWIANYWAHYYASIQVPTLMFSKEMTAERVSDRQEAIRYKLPFDLMRAGDLPPSTLKRWMVQRRIDAKVPVEYPLFITGEETIEGSGMSAVISKIEEVKPVVAIIDGAYLLTAEGVSKKANMVEQFAALSRKFKSVSKYLKVVSVLVLQTNRGAEKSDGTTKGGVTNLYGSDTWAQDADLAIIVQGKRGAPTRVLSIVKSRDSAIGDINIAFKLFPFPDFKEIAGGSSMSAKSPIPSSNQVTYKGVA